MTVKTENPDNHWPWSNISPPNNKPRFVTEASSIGPSNVVPHKCPACKQPFAPLTPKYREGEIILWEGRCHACKVPLTIFND